MYCGVIHKVRTIGRGGGPAKSVLARIEGVGWGVELQEYVRHYYYFFTSLLQNRNQESQLFRQPKNSIPISFILLKSASSILGLFFMFDSTFCDRIYSIVVIFNAVCGPPTPLTVKSAKRDKSLLFYAPLQQFFSEQQPPQSFLPNGGKLLRLLHEPSQNLI